MGRVTTAHTPRLSEASNRHRDRDSNLQDAGPSGDAGAAESLSPLGSPSTRGSPVASAAALSPRSLLATSSTAHAALTDTVAVAAALPLLGQPSSSTPPDFPFLDPMSWRSVELTSSPLATSSHSQAVEEHSSGTLLLANGGRSKYLGPNASSEWLRDVSLRRRPWRRFGWAPVLRSGFISDRLQDARSAYCLGPSWPSPAGVARSMNARP